MNSVSNVAHGGIMYYIYQTLLSHVLVPYWGSGNETNMNQNQRVGVSNAYSSSAVDFNLEKPVEIGSKQVMLEILILGTVCVITSHHTDQSGMFYE